MRCASSVDISYALSLILGVYFFMEMMVAGKMTNCIERAFFSYPVSNIAFFLAAQLKMLTWESSLPSPPKR